MFSSFLPCEDLKPARNCSLAANFLVDDVRAEAVARALHLGDQVGQFLDGFNL